MKRKNELKSPNNDTHSNEFELLNSLKLETTFKEQKEWFKYMLTGIVVILFPILMISGIISIISLLLSLSMDNSIWKDNGFHILIAISAIFLLCEIKIRFKKMPMNFEGIDDWIVKNERNKLLFRSLSLFFLIFACFTENKNDNALNQYFITMVVYFSYMGAIFLNLYKPQLLLSANFSKLGIIVWASYMAVLLGNIYYYGGAPKIQHFITFSAIVAVINAIVGYYKKINVVQLYSIRMIKASVLRDALKGFAEKMFDKKSAIQFYKTLEKKDNPGVEKELLKLLNEKYMSKRSLVISIFWILITFIVTSLGEGLLQDLFLNNIESLFCKHFNLLCK